MFFRRFLYINDRGAPPVFRIRHIPERQHVLDRRDQKRMRIHVAERRRRRPDQQPVDIDRTAAHSLHKTAIRIGKSALAAGDNIWQRTAVRLVHAEDFRVKAHNISGWIDDRIERAFHSRGYLRQRQNIRHRRRDGTIQIQRH